MADSGIRAQIRKDLRDYDNPKSGRNLNYLNKKYMLELEQRYGMDEASLRAFANSSKKKGNRE